ncbi:hypothetical protein ACLKA7_007434 [Drosophila subpalustris]
MNPCTIFNHGEERPVLASSSSYSYFRCSCSQLLVLLRGHCLRRRHINMQAPDCGFGSGLGSDWDCEQDWGWTRDWDRVWDIGILGGAENLPGLLLPLPLYGF